MSLFAFFWILFCDLPGRQNPVLGSFLFIFFIDLHSVWSSGRDLVIVYISESLRFLCLILQNRFRVVHIAFAPLVKFQFLAQFLMDRLFYLFVSSLILFCANLLFTIKPTVAILLHLIYFCFNIICLYGVALCIYLKKFSFSLKFSFS